VFVLQVHSYDASGRDETSTVVKVDHDAAALRAEEELTKDTARAVRALGALSPKTSL
jgi:hypothetical protein